ncbi:hypothetical protein G7Y89_g15304 [Cudoniella acicularis]|uniref:MutL C-terminal dimerisation domain-containing protein n=1 Tax=Cudoniella acicularis TaxID=354080 RepID=A0A8H4QSH4_9HELO|nr:hypothetical protein G7Y89_g15304 [Cudoniella acicularis]
MSIQPLPPDVIAQIKSSTTITSLNGVVDELVKNSLDAGCTKINITVDYARGGCVVEDDGLGILPSEFRENGGLGKLYHSSKLNSQTPVHGGRGTFLASLSAMALLSVTSRHHQHYSHNTISMHKSEVVARQIPSPTYQNLPYPDHGTRVTVCDLFGNMPVRVKQRAIMAEKPRGNSKGWGILQQNVVLLFLAWPRDVAVTVREIATLQKLIFRPHPGLSSSRVISTNQISIPKVCSILSQASFITPDEKSSWLHVSASTSKIRIEGTISLSPSATKQVQFLSFGIQPLLALDGQNILHDEINRLFLNSAFGDEGQADDLGDAEKARRANDRRYKSDGFTNKELKGGRKGVERWPMFYINICPNIRKQSHLELDEILDDKENILGEILDLLQAMILEFLTSNQFRPKANRRHQKRTVPGPGSPISNAETTSKRNGLDVARATRPNLNPAVGTKESSPMERSGGSNTLQPQIDILGTNVKLPSFRRSSSQIDSPFDSWSKVKQGTAAHKNAGHKPEGTEDSHTSTLHKKGTRSSPSVNLQHTIKAESSAPLISSTGRLLRQPFIDVEIVRAPSKKPPSQPSQPLAVDAGGNDDLIEWTNPITKVKSLINQRTGLTVVDRSKPKQSVGSAVAQCRQNLKSQHSSKREEPSVWMKNLLKNWDNPVFKPSEASIPQVSMDCLELASQEILHGRRHHCSQVDIDRAFKESSSNINGRISKNALRSAEVISQVDKKFILVKLTPTDISTNPKETQRENGMLVIIDQHAADERIRVESLMEELCIPSNDTTIPPDGTDFAIISTQLDKPLVYEISSREIQLLRSHRNHFRVWGILYDLPKDHIHTNQKGKSIQHLVVHSLPPGIAERCKLDPRLLISLIRTEAWKCDENEGTNGPLLAASNSENQPASKQAWIHIIQNCPQGILDMLNSRACRSAIMFNDELTREQCELLVRKLADCLFPFQCAHGRPSLTPLVDLKGFGLDEFTGTAARHSANDKSFGETFRNWKQNLRDTNSGG